MKSRFRETIIEDNGIFKITGDVEGGKRNEANCLQQSNVGCENFLFFRHSLQVSFIDSHQST